VAVDRMLPSGEAEDLLRLTVDIADRELAPRVQVHERTETYPEGLFALLGRAGLLGLPYPEEYGGGGQPYEVYLQVLEELAMRWAAVAVTVSVHGLSCFPLATFGTPGQQERWLPDLVTYDKVGAWAITEPDSGSDAFGGMKSYGRAPTFLMITGYEQVRSIAADIAGDHEDAARVELVLPETGVCNRSAAPDASSCCGGPALSAVDACCAADADARQEGKTGCGCAS